jgi:hypothetical protein
MKTEVIKFSDFTDGTWNRQQIQLEKIKQDRFRKIEMTVRVGLMVVTLVAIPVDVFAASGVDVAGKRLYKRLLNIGKWVIVIKGGIDLIQSMFNGDMQKAKSTFMTYLLIFAALLGLPFALDEIENLFNEAW